MKTMKWLLGVAVAAAIVVPLQSANAEGGGLYGGGSDGVTRLGDYRGDDDGVYRVHYRGHRGYYGRRGYHYRGHRGYYGPPRYYGRYGYYYRGHRGYYGHPGYYGRPWYGYRGPVVVAPPPPPPW